MKTQRYTPFGEVRTDGNLATDHTYTGQVHDESSGLAFYNARYYDPAIGRFVTPDSIVPNRNNGQDYNRYSYVRNNPVRLSDPTRNDPACLYAGGSCTQYFAGHRIDVAETQPTDYVGRSTPATRNVTVTPPVPAASDILTPVPTVDLAAGDQLQAAGFYLDYQYTCDAAGCGQDAFDRSFPGVSLGFHQTAECSRISFLGVGCLRAVVSTNFQAKAAQGRLFVGDESNSQEAQAFLHAYWIGLLSNELGEFEALRFGLAHELDSGRTLDTAKDLVNNLQGAILAREVDPIHLEAVVFDAATSGLLACERDRSRIESC